MGSASCKNPKSSEQPQQKETSKKITIGVFGLDNAGKTSTVKAIEGAPTRDVDPTMSSETSKVPYPTTGKGDNKSQERITIIDVSGAKKFRERSWPEYYNQIHGLIFVIDASEKKRIMENQDTLDDLLNNDDLKDKPILILANKQDRRGAINTEDHIKNKLQIEKLQRKHKIELCSAIPGDDNKTDNSIRQGFSWLIRTIESNYTQLNSLVNNSKNSRPPKPMERKSQINNRHKNEKSDQSDNDDGIVYANKRTVSPPFNRKTTTDYRSTINSTKLPNLDLNKTKPKPPSYETHSESDNDDGIHARSRPTIFHPDYESNNRNQPNLTSTSGFNKKKKVIGGASNINDVLNKRSNDNEPKSFRAPYEQFPEETSWLSPTRKTTKIDDITSKSYTKPSIINDPTKRTISPLVHDTKSISKRDNLSDDDDDDFNRKQKLKPTLPSINKPSSTFKKPTSGIYGADDDDDDEKNSNINRRSNFATSTTTKKPFKYDDDDDENDYLKKTTSKTTKSFDSDDDETKNKNNINKNFQRPSDRFNLNTDYRGITTKPPPSPSTTASRSKIDEKPLNRPKFNKDDYLSTFSKPATSSRFNDDDDDDRPLSTSKITAHSKYSDDDHPSSASKFGTHSKYDNDYSSSSKPLTRPKYGDDNRSSSPLRSVSRTKQEDDDLPLSSKPTARSRYDDDDDFPSTSKPITRLKYDNDDRPSSALKSTSHSKFEDDDYGLSSKPTIRSNYKDNDRSSSPLKPTSHSKFEDDDYGSSSKPTIRSNYRDNDRLSSPLKPISQSKFEDDDYGSSSKPTTRSNYRDNDRSSPPLKQTARSKYDDDDDDYGSSSKPTTRSNYRDNDRSSSPVKQSSRWKHDDDDDDRSSSPIKPASRSKFDDDDYSSSPKKTNYSSRDDDYSGVGGARSRFGKDEFDSSKGGLNSGRAISASPNRFRSNAKSDT